MLRKVSVDDLEIGMYVAELDRPWLESPFLFQGFIVETDDDLAQLRETCAFVMVDELRSRDEGSLSGLIRAKAEAGQVRTVTVEAADQEPAKPGTATTSEGFVRGIKAAVQTKEKAHSSIKRVLEDFRLGRSIDTNESKELVSELVTEISSNANTVLWLTNLRKKHEYTANHCLNVSIISIAFGRHLGLENDQLEVLGLGALLHDVGKMRTPTEILDKPGPLTPEEIDVIKRHPVEGFNVLRLTKNLPEEALEAVRWHHERIDGSGYPDGLGAEHIPLMAQIVGIADIYESMTSNKPYRDGIPPQDALTMMHKDAARVFGQAMMENFIKCVGIYPIGSLVELKSGALGIVLSSNPESRLRPLVMVIRDEKGKEMRPRALVNLGTLPADKVSERWAIKQVVNPKEHGVDISAIAEEELVL